MLALGNNVSYYWTAGSGLFPNKVTGVNSSTLVIPDARSSDEDIYTCVATTHKGCSLSNVTQLIITGKIFNNLITKRLTFIMQVYHQ